MELRPGVEPQPPQKGACQQKIIKKRTSYIYGVCETQSNRRRNASEMHAAYKIITAIHQTIQLRVLKTREWAKPSSDTTPLKTHHENHRKRGGRVKIDSTLLYTKPSSGTTKSTPRAEAELPAPNAGETEQPRSLPGGQKPSPNNLAWAYSGKHDVLSRIGGNTHITRLPIARRAKGERRDKVNRKLDGCAAENLHR